MSKRKYEPGAFVPCSIKHKQCSPAHSALVAGYRDERYRQEKIREEETNGYKGEEKLWDQNNKLITFKMWLRASKQVRSETTSTFSQIDIMKMGRSRNNFAKVNGKMIPTFKENDDEQENRCWLCGSYGYCYLQSDPRCPRRPVYSVRPG